jgi:hypothetical protein
MRGGTYHGTYRLTVGGVSGQPVVVRGYPGERPIIDAAGTPGGGPSIWYVGAPWTVSWGFELTDSDPNRVSTQTGNAGRPNTIANYANHSKYVSLIVHDGGVGFYNDAQQSDVEITGCVFYNNGWQGPDRGHGHAIYLRSNIGPVSAHDNVMFNQFGYGVHVFTDPGEYLYNIQVEGNIAFNNGTLSNNGTSSNILLGGDDLADGDVVSDNLTYFPRSLSAYNMRIGWGTLVNGSVVVASNYVTGGTPVLDVGYWTSLSASGNDFIGTGSLVSLNDSAIAASTFSGQTSSSIPTGTKVFVRPVPYETGCANIAVYNWGGLSSVSVDLDGIVPLGSPYEIRNVFDLFGTPVASGIFDGSAVTLPIQAMLAPTPVGWTRGPSGGTEFNAYVVTVPNR